MQGDQREQVSGCSGVGEQTDLTDDPDGDGLANLMEYAIAGGLVGLAVVAAFQALGLTVGNVIEAIDDILTANIPA